MYEACHWIVSADTDLYRDDTDAYIELRFEKLENAQAFIYQGSDRHNVTAFIEANQTASLGAPFRVPISTKLIVVAHTLVDAGNVAFSY